MEDVQSSLELASQLESKGQIKDAYEAYLDTVKLSLQPLYGVKFIQTSVIQKPKQYANLISAIRTCLEQIESIVERHSPESPLLPQPVKNHQSEDSTKFIKPRLPPKPSHIQYPTLPPKPARPNVLSTPSVTHDDDSSDMNLVQDIIPRRSPFVPANHRHSVPSPVDKRAEHLHIRPHTEFVPNDTQEVSLNLGTDYQIDPKHLAPARIDSSLCPDMQKPADHVPLIPVPPLLTMYRELQANVNELEDELKAYRKRQTTTNPDGGRSSLDALSEDELTQRVIQLTRHTVDAKKRLNDVRTLYMEAGTIEDVMHFQPHVMAYQVTLIDAAIFKAIPSTALLTHSAKKPSRHIVASTDFFNYVTRTIEHSVLFPQSKADRAQHIHYWVKVAQRCLELNNYQTLKAIISALRTPPVQRLRQTWDFVPKKSLNKLDSLNELMSEADNYGRYREHMGMVNATVINGKSVSLIRREHTEKPTVPFLGILIYDITYLLAAFKSSTQSKTMAPEDEPRIREILQIVEKFQNGPQYTEAPSDSYVKSTHKHGLGSTISSASSALHRSASGIARFSLFGSNSNNSSNNSSGGAGNNSPTTSVVSSENETDANEGKEIDQMAMQYILTRPWADQTTIDQFSSLREPQKPTSQLQQQQQRARSSGGGSATGSVMSSTSSMMRFSSGSMSLHTSSTTGNGDSRPTSMEEEDEEKSRFWPFRRSVDTQRPPSLSQPDGITIVDSSNTMTNSASTTTGAPLIPPRPPSMNESDEFKAALAARLAKTRRQV